MFQEYINYQKHGLAIRVNFATSFYFFIFIYQFVLWHKGLYPLPRAHWVSSLHLNCAPVLFLPQKESPFLGMGGTASTGWHSMGDLIRFQCFDIELLILQSGRYTYFLYALQSVLPVRVTLNRIRQSCLSRNVEPPNLHEKYPVPAFASWD